MVEKLTTKKYNLRAKFGPEEYEEKASKLDMASNQKRLDRNLIVARDARIIINQNINTGLGICNGSTGKIYDFVFEDGEIKQILVQLSEKYTGPSVVPNVERIIPLARQQVIDNESNKYYCLQFPISLAYSFTIDKSQGMTLPGKVFIDIGSSEAIGQTYVALSRCKQFKNILLQNFSEKRFKS